jgi:proteasome accessory factor B
VTAPITKTQRWLDLIALLIGRRVPVTVEEIMEQMPAYAVPDDADQKARDSARRKFERDKDELRAAGIPIESARYSINFGGEVVEGYRIGRKDFYLPYLRLIGREGGGAEAGRADPPMYRSLPRVELAASEAAPAFDALRRVADLPGFPFQEAARSALRKLAFDLEDDGEGAPVIWVGRPGVEEVLAKLRVISDALLARKRVGFTYAGIRRGAATSRRVAPFGLFYTRDWYLVGHDETRSAIRVFRVGRMTEIEPDTARPKTRDFEVPADFRIGAYLDRAAWELGEQTDSVEVELLFHFPRSIVASRNGEGEMVEQRPDGSSVRRFSVSQPDPFVRWVLGLQGEAEILRPAYLREELAETAREVVKIHRRRKGMHG